MQHEQQAADSTELPSNGVSEKPTPRTRIDLSPSEKVLTARVTSNLQRLQGHLAGLRRAFLKEEQGLLERLSQIRKAYPEQEAEILTKLDQAEEEQLRLFGAIQFKYGVDFAEGGWAFEDGAFVRSER